MSATGNPTRSAALRAYGDVFLSTVEAWQLAETNLQNAVATQLQPTHSHRRSHVGRVRVDVLLISAMAGTTHGPPTVVFHSLNVNGRDRSSSSSWIVHNGTQLSSEGLASPIDRASMTVAPERIAARLPSTQHAVGGRCCRVGNATRDGKITCCVSTPLPPTLRFIPL